MKKILVLLMGILFMLGAINVQADQKIVFSGEAYLDIPQRDWTSFDDVKNIKARASFDDLSLENEELSLDGSITYDGTEFAINYDLELMNSVQDANNAFMLVSDEKLLKEDNGDDLKLVHGAIRNETPMNKALINNKLREKPMISLYFFNENTNDLLMFEQPIPGKIKKQLDLIDPNSLGETNTDLWEHRVVEPRFESGDNISPMAAETRTISKYAYYETAFGLATHYIELSLHGNMNSYPGNSDTQVSSIVEVEEAYARASTGEQENGWSNIRATPTQHWETVDLGNGKDLFFEKKFDGDFSGSAPEVSLSIGWGPLSTNLYNTGDHLPNDSIERGGFELIKVEHDGDYNVSTESDYSGSYIRDVEQKYDTAVKVRNEDGTRGPRAVRSTWTVDFEAVNYDGNLSSEIAVVYLRYDRQF
ncbi:hypothetical protein [Alkalibacillus aidingensis]|uniref:hypothetical protein n=1 Tax=Alkalibacillus aidingensis TaxID=2747607 RepID=UPI001661533F|nr:hypothetical protein [Alkalibacillus aidingensis]